MREDIRYVEVKHGNNMSWKQFLLWVGIFAAMQYAVWFVLPAVKPVKYEYRTYYLQASADGLIYGQDLNRFGREGWELIDIIEVDRKMHACYFKRPTNTGGPERSDSMADSRL